ncbi:hypothetical protein PsorP6_015187 [Peronosclerospora sorghi]|uniref:Uncharacterized protein n=1 Tax=Peronosclerospora sorghi TaxID=230839 RepID=A0ACC0VTP9_9STRA|nr:hypothetical protein PsorP6_015187 [Peronosclerospora sorghi]
MADEQATWDAVGVVAHAKAMIQSSNYEKVSDARKGVDETLAHWVAALASERDATKAVHGKAAVVALWRQYAALEIELRQFKQATKVFERAVTCPVAGSSLALWLQYADFCVQRNKFSNARKVFVRALETLAVGDQTAVWARFYGFVCTHVDSTLSLAMLQHQVMPDKFPPPCTTASTSSSTHVTASSSCLPSVAATSSLPSTLHPHTVPSSGTRAEVALVDPVVAFIDKTGEDTLAPSPLAVESVGSTLVTGEAARKRPRTDPELASDAKKDMEPTAYFAEIPLTLPCIPTCPHLLFDNVADKDAQKQIDTKLLERLSDVLSDCAVFEGVRDLRDNQRVRDREMLYRWQELVGMQMKEGSELFARHVALELQHGFTDPRGLIALKTQHLEQRREFTTRCLMSQQQFIDICAMDRANALQAQQISMENMKIPEMNVTMDAERIQLQRAIVGLILEAQALWQEENQRVAAEASGASSSSRKSLDTSSSPSRASARPRRDSQDSNTSSFSASRSSSGRTGKDPRGSRSWNGPRRRDRDPRAGPGRSNKWDVEPPQAAGPAPSQPHSSRYEYPSHQAPPRAQEQQQHMPPMYDRMQLQQQPRQFQPQAYGASPFDKYGGPQEYAPPSGAAYFTETDRFVGQGGPSRVTPAGSGWPQQQPPQQPPQHFPPQPVRQQRPGPCTPGEDFGPCDPSLARYGGPEAPRASPYGGPVPSYYPDPSHPPPSYQQQQPPPRDPYPAYAMPEPYGPRHAPRSPYPTNEHLLPSPSPSVPTRRHRRGRYRR